MEITLQFMGIEFDVEFDYQPMEKEVMYYSDGSGYPGCAEAVEGVSKFEHKGTDFYEFIEMAGLEEEVDDAILEQLHEQ